LYYSFIHFIVSVCQTKNLLTLSSMYKKINVYYNIVYVKYVVAITITYNESRIKQDVMFIRMTTTFYIS